MTNDPKPIGGLFDCELPEIAPLTMREVLTRPTWKDKRDRAKRPRPAKKKGAGKNE